MPPRPITRISAASEGCPIRVAWIANTASRIVRCFLFISGPFNGSHVVERFPCCGAVSRPSHRSDRRWGPWAGRATRPQRSPDVYFNTVRGSGATGTGERIWPWDSSRIQDEEIKKQLNDSGIYVKSASPKVLTEEAPQAYKRVDDVVEIAHGAGISEMVARMVPLGVMKG